MEADRVTLGGLSRTAGARDLVIGWYRNASWPAISRLTDYNPNPAPRPRAELANIHARAQPWRCGYYTNIHIPR